MPPMFERKTPLPTKSPHLPPSPTIARLPFKLPLNGHSYLGHFPPIHPLVPPWVQRNPVLSAFVALVTLFLIFSASSPLYSGQTADNLPTFPSRGLKKELWQYLNSIHERELVVEPVVVPFVREPTPSDPVPWVATDLFPRSTSQDSPLRDSSSSAKQPSESQLLVPRHRIEVHPLRPVLPRNVVPLDRFIFGIVTTTYRAKQMSALWGHWLTPDNEPNEGQPACLILIHQEEQDSDIKELREVIKQRSLPCAVQTSQLDRYETRVLSMTVEMRDYGAMLGRSFDWYVFNDDDTFWVDQRTLRRMLAKYDPRDDWLIGTVSESKSQLESFGRMAYGGAGLLISDTLGLKLYNKWDTCWENWKHIFGGDEMITRCAALVLGKTKQTVTTHEKGLHQFDVPGDTTGVFQSGMSILNLHHYIGGSWVHIFGYGSYKNDMEQILLLRRVMDFLGGDNMFKRYVFGNGKWLLTQGYSLTVFEQPLVPHDLTKAEHTWYEEYLLTIPDRPAIPERHDWKGKNVKQTFYVDDIKVISTNEALITYAMADKWDEHLGSRDRVRIQMLWDGCWDPFVPGCGERTNVARSLAALDEEDQIAPKVDSDLADDHPSR